MQFFNLPPLKKEKQELWVSSVIKNAVGYATQKTDADQGLSGKRSGGYRLVLLLLWVVIPM